MSIQINPTLNHVIKQAIKNELYDYSQAIQQDFQILGAGYDEHPEILDPYTAAAAPERSLPVLEIICNYEPENDPVTVDPQPDETQPPVEPAAPSLLEIIPSCSLSDLEDISHPENRLPLEIPIVMPFAVAGVSAQYALYMPNQAPQNAKSQLDRQAQRLLARAAEYKRQMSRKKSAA